MKICSVYYVVKINLQELVYGSSQASEEAVVANAIKIHLQTALFIVFTHWYSAKKGQYPAGYDAVLVDRPHGRPPDAAHQPKPSGV